MCGVLGIYGHVSPPVVYDLLVESQIRGKHATGVSYLKRGKLHTIVEPLPAEEFVMKHNVSDMMDWEYMQGEWYESYKLIAHCRYSTSDIRFNQPIADETHAIVHNGVITQEPPEKWKELYGYDTKTTNDSELLFLSYKKDVLKLWDQSSIAAIYLDNKGNMIYFRNGKRPLYHDIGKDYTIVTSTPDIYKRVTGKEATLIEPYVYYMVDMYCKVRLKSAGSGPDLQ